MRRINYDSLLKRVKSFDEISSIMGKSRLSVKGKLFNSGLNSLVVATSMQRSVATTTPDDLTTGPLMASTPVPVVNVAKDEVVDVDLKLPEELPSVDAELKGLAAAVEALRQPGLSRAEASRQHNIIAGVKVYQELYAKFVDYCGLETELLELRKKFESLNAKSSNNSSSQVSLR